MRIAQSKNKLIAATALFVAIGLLSGPAGPSAAQQVGQEEQFGQVGQVGETIVRQGTVISTQDPLPGHEEHQRATILPLTEDDTVYAGVLTYTATEPVEVVVLNKQNLNETEQALMNATVEEFGTTLLTSEIDNQTSIAITIITPEYGDTPIPSASIPFAGNAVWLHTIDGTPFIASYAVSAQTQQAEVVNNIVNITAIAEAEEEEEEEEEEEAEVTANATATEEENAEGT